MGDEKYTIAHVIKCSEGFLVLQKKEMVHGESKQTMN